MYNEQREIEYQSKQKEKKAQTSFSYLQNMTPPPHTNLCLESSTESFLCPIRQKALVRISA
jgi:hypothetical protein